MRMWNGSEDARELSERDVEVWVGIDTSPNRYRVSNLGNVVSNVKGQDWRRVKNTQVQSGYLCVGIYPEAGSKADTRQLHRLVIKCFDGNSVAPEHTDVRHLNGIKTDCRLCNLKYGTRSENMLDVWTHRRAGMPSVEARIANATPSDSERAWFSGYTSDPYLLQVGLEFMSERKLTINDLSRMWNCSIDVASNIVNGETRSEVKREPPPVKQTRRSPAAKDRILDLVRQGFNVAQINETLGETLTAQDVYYYKTKEPKAMFDKTNSQMSDEIVVSILNKAKETGWGAPKLAKHFSKGVSTISNILAGTSYTHIPR